MITPPFETIWPDVERRLRGLLYRRGLDPASTDDVVQEVALRALATRVTYVSALDLLRWAGPVACNLHVDLLRQRARLADGGVDQDRPASHDVAREVADRMELQRAFRGIARLRPADREAIVDAMTGEPVRGGNRKEAVRLAVRRHRARSRLALVLEQLAVWPVAWRWARPSRASVALTVAAVPVALPLLLGVRPPAAELPATPAQPPASAPRTEPIADVRRAPVRAATEKATETAAVTRPAAAREPAPAPGGAWRGLPRPKATLNGPGGTGARIEGREQRPDDRTLCAHVLSFLPDVCV